MNNLGELLDESDPQRWYWWGRAAVLRRPDRFLAYFSDVVESFNSGSGNGYAVFQIGKALNGRVSKEKRTMFGKKSANFDTRIGPANSAISFYESQISACRLAVDAWSHVGIRCGVAKDIRILIGKLVWETRDLALFRVPKPSAKASAKPSTKRATQCVCF
jgi:hypothetical protein